MHQQASNQRGHEQHVAQTTEPGYEKNDNQSQGVHARMKYKISGEISDTKVVREQGGRQLHWFKNFRQQRFHPL